MDDSFARREACRLRRVSAAADMGYNVSLQDDNVTMETLVRKARPVAGRLSSAAGRMERRNSAPQVVHQRHMPMEPNKFHIPRKTKEKKALFQFVSTESREYEDMKTILTSGYIDPNSSGCFTYSNPRLVHSELLEKEFVEKKKEMKADGRTDKELEKSYSFLLTTSTMLSTVCEKGLTSGQSRITVLGNPEKGVYLSRYSDLLQSNPLTPGTTGEIIIFKVMKGKVKSIYENMKTVQDPTPRFDSHIAKNASKVTSLTCYRAFELTQQYFYEYSFDELRQRPRQVCPYAVVSFQFKGKDTPLPSKPPTPVRLNSQLSEGNKACAQFTVWTGDLVKNKRTLFQISLHSSFIPFLPHRLPEKLDVGYLIGLDEVSRLLPPRLISYSLYNSSKEVVIDGHYCSLLEVTDRTRSTTNVMKLLQELELKRVVLVSPLTERGFLFLLSSVQMATPSERGGPWKRCLQALFVFPEPRDVSEFSSCCTSSPHESLTYNASVMPRIKEFIPALHHALVKARANPSSNLSAGVELQTQEYLSSLKDGNVRQYPMTEYDTKLDEEGKQFPPPKQHQVNMDNYLQSYLSNPALYLLSVSRAKKLVETHCVHEQPPETTPRNIRGGQRVTTGNNREGQTNDQKGKRKMEQKTAERALKYFKVSQETGRRDGTLVGGNRVPPSSISYGSVIGSLGLKDVDLREDGSELTGQFITQLKDLFATANQSYCEAQEEGVGGSSPFERLATKLGLPTNCDIDLRKQEELEEQTAGSISSLEGFSPGSHSGETNHHGGAVRGGGGGGGGGGGLGMEVEVTEEDETEWEIPWVLIPITGLSSERYSQRDRNVPQDPRFQHLTSATSITTTATPSRMGNSLFPEPSPPPSNIQYPSPDPSPPISPSQCPSPDPSSPISPSQCPSPDPSPPPSPYECPSPLPSPPGSPAHSPLPENTPPPASSQCLSLELKELNPFNRKHSGANELQLASTVLREFPGVSSEKEMKLQGKEIIKEEPSASAHMDPYKTLATELRNKPSPPPTEPVKEAERETGNMEEVKAQRLESQPSEEEQNQRKEVDMCKHIKTEKEEVTIEVAKEQEEMGEVQEPDDGSTFSPSVASNPACPQRDIDSIVDKHLGDFSSDIQLLLQEESGNYNFPQPLHSCFNTETSPSQHTLPYASLSPFSHYVSFYNPCPPVHDYVNSLKDGITCMLTEIDENWRRHQPDTSRTNVDATLADTIQDFVSSVRAANTATGRNDEVLPFHREQTAIGVESSVSQDSVFSRGDEVWQPDNTNWGRSAPHHLSLSEPTPASSSYKPEDTSEISSTVTQNTREAQDNSTVRTVVCTDDEEGEESLAGTSCIVTVPGYHSVPDASPEPSHSFEAASSTSSALILDPASEPVPSTKHLNSVINQLNPDVLNNLVEIAKDIKRRSPQFYIHCTEPGDPVNEEVKEHLLKLGNVQQSPVDFLHQENTENGLLVIIKNIDIAGHIHKIPGLKSLKQHSSVVFVGIDSLDDVKNNSCIELFVSGGCIVSDELVLSPDVISHERLAALLTFLEQQSSPESVWRWKIHCKTHKKLKEQARFRKDAANLLDMLSAYQKRQIVEFLPYHHCDTVNHQSPDFKCLIELQARYTQFRHTIYLTEHHFEKFPAYSSGGIIVTSVEDILQSFTGLVGCHSIRDKQLLVEDLLAPKGVGRQLNHQDSATGYELSPSTLPENIYPTSSSSQAPEVLPQPPSTPPSLPHVTDQIVPDAFSKDSMSPTTSTDMEFLQQAIRQLRAQRLEQVKQLKQQQELLKAQGSTSDGSIPSPVGSGTPPPVHEGSTEFVRPMPSRNTVTATLDSVHSVLQPDVWDEERRGMRRRQGSPREGWERGGSPEGEELGGQREGTPLRVVRLQTGNLTPGPTDSSALLSNQTAAAVTEPSIQTDPDSDGSKEGTNRQGEPEIQAAAEHDPSTEEDNRSRDTQLNQTQPVITEMTPQNSSTASVSQVTRIPVLPDWTCNPNPTSNPEQTQQHPQVLSEQPCVSTYNQQPQPGVGLLQTPYPAPFHSQPFRPGSLLGPLRPLGGVRPLIRPTHLWPGGFTPPGPHLVWGFQQTGMDFLRGYCGPAGPGGHIYRGSRPGGGFNGM